MGTTTEGSTRPWATSRQSNTSKPTTLLSTESRTPYRNGREPGELRLEWVGMQGRCRWPDPRVGDRMVRYRIVNDVPHKEGRPVRCRDWKDRHEGGRLGRQRRLEHEEQRSSG